MQLLVWSKNSNPLFWWELRSSRSTRSRLFSSGPILHTLPLPAHASVQGSIKFLIENRNQKILALFPISAMVITCVLSPEDQWCQTLVFSLLWQRKTIILAKTGLIVEILIWRGGINFLTIRGRVPVGSLFFKNFPLSTGSCSGISVFSTEDSS